MATDPATDPAPYPNGLPPLLGTPPDCYLEGCLTGGFDALQAHRAAQQAATYAAAVAEDARAAARRAQQMEQDVQRLAHEVRDAADHEATIAEAKQRLAEQVQKVRTKARNVIDARNNARIARAAWLAAGGAAAQRQWDALASPPHALEMPPLLHLQQQRDSIH